MKRKMKESEIKKAYDKWYDNPKRIINEKEYNLGFDEAVLCNPYDGYVDEVIHYKNGKSFSYMMGYESGWLACKEDYYKEKFIPCLNSLH